MTRKVVLLKEREDGSMYELGRTIAHTGESVETVFKRCWRKGRKPPRIKQIKKYTGKAEEGTGGQNGFQLLTAEYDAYYILSV